MEEIEILCEEIEDITLEDTREVVTIEKPVYPELENLVVTPSNEEQTFSDWYSEVKVLGDEDLVASNIKKDVEIFGVVGNLEELTTETKEGINNQEEIITNQETTLEEINQVIQDKILAKEKYKPRYLYNQQLFRNYTGTELDHETQMLDTTNFTNMSFMFTNCSNLISLDLSSWVTSDVTNMDSMFYGCNKLTELNLSSWVTSKVTNMSYMFYENKSMNNLDLSSFDTSNVTNLSYMFYGCTNIEKINIANFNTNNVNIFRDMFRTCGKLIELDLSGWETTNATNITNMFNYCSSLTKLDIRNFTFDKVTSYSNAFYGIPNNCLIIVKGQTEKDWVLARRSDLTNVKTVAELEG